MALREDSSTAQTTSDDPARRYAWRVFSVTTLGAMLTAVNASTLDVALPTVSRHFSATPAEANWFLLAYMLVNTVFILVFGRLADLVGRRLLYISGLALFTCASFGCGFAPNAQTLIALRAVQAVGAASVITNTTALLADAFPPKLLSVGLGMNITVASAFQIAGPLIGGAMATFFGWRAVFLFNVPTGLVGVAWARIVLRRQPRQRRIERFDFPSAAISALVLGGLVVALSEGGTRGWTDPLVVAAATIAVVAFPLFIWLQAVRRHPLIDLTLVRSRTRGAAYLCSFAATAARFAVVLVVSIFIQAADGLNAFQAGVRVMPSALGVMLASPVSGRLVGRVGAFRLARVGLTMASVGLLVLGLTLQPSTPGPVLGVELFVIGLGGGLFLPANTSAILDGVPAQRRGVANGIRSMLQNTGTVVGTAMSLALATNALSAPEKRAAYAGTLGQVRGADLALFVRGTHYALLGLCVLTTAATLLLITTPNGPGAKANSANTARGSLPPPRS